jgi:alkylation response protein AidB-like acyl-CoA dehydrogenase
MVTAAVSCRLSEEQRQIRITVRSICATALAINAAAADEAKEFPASSYDTLRACDLYAPGVPASYSVAGSMITRATMSGCHYLLNGVKRRITHAGLSDFCIVFAVTDSDAGPHGISAFVVEKADAGLSFSKAERKLGLKGSPTRPGDGVAFVHTVGFPDSAGTRVTAWEMLWPS